MLDSIRSERIEKKSSRLHLEQRPDAPPRFCNSPCVLGQESRTNRGCPIRTPGARLASGPEPTTVLRVESKRAAATRAASVLARLETGRWREIRETLTVRVDVLKDLGCK